LAAEIKDVAPAAFGSDVEKIVLLPLYPHYSITTTGSSFNECRRAYIGPADR
jgi:ferrochelatase